MTKRQTILISMVLGMAWAIGIVILGRGPIGGLENDGLFNFVALGLFPGGLVLIALIGRLAQRRFFDDTIIDGEPFLTGSPADIDQKVLQNTVEQLILAICIWPFAAATLGLHLLLWLGVGFGLTRILFWVGYHISPPLRGFGFAAGFYPTVLAGLYALWAAFV